ncbi:MAG TPA: hypothetical protein VF450_02205, partial [Noviherbaspirillum sp.]
MFDARWVFIVMATMAGALMAPGANAASAARSRLNMLCSAAQEWCALLALKYEQRFHVPVQVTQMSTNAALDEIRT